MARRRRRPSSSKPHWLAGWARSVNDETKRRWARMALNASVVLVAVVSGVVGLEALKRHVYELEQYQCPLELQAVNTPPWLSDALRDRILTDVRIRADDRLLDDRLVPRITQDLSASGWVKRVRRVEKHCDGRITIDCEYRQPVAVVQQHLYYYLVDAEGVRLPGTYASAGEWLIIQGAVSPAPDVGREWPGQDARAGARLAAMVINQPFAEQLTGINVGNYHGRLDPSRPQIKLITAPSGSSQPASVIFWGSPPGEEIEEPTPADKIAVLSSNYDRGRIDAGYPWIDLTVGKNQFGRPRNVEPHAAAWRS